MPQPPFTEHGTDPRLLTKPLVQVWRFRVFGSLSRKGRSVKRRGWQVLVMGATTCLFEYNAFKHRCYNPPIGRALSAAQGEP